MEPRRGTPEETRAGYDKVARAYAQRFKDELAHKPFDRERLDAFADRVRGRGPVLDLGCGPGQVAAYLAARGLEAGGLDLSPRMIERARALHPGLELRVGDLRAPTVERMGLAVEGGFAGLVAFYSLIHVPREEMVAVLGRLREALAPEGLLLIAFHVGEEILRVEALLGEEVAIDFHFFGRGEMEGYLREAGFALIEGHERGPYAPEVEAQTRRAYLLGGR